MKKLAVLFISCLFVSCTEDSQTTTQVVTMTGYKIDVNTSSGFDFITTGNLVNNKLYSETYETIANGISQGTTIEQKYFYNTDGTLDHWILSNRTTYLYYDANQNLIGAKLLMNDDLNGMNFRFIHLPNNIIFFERIGQYEYNDPNAVASGRIILQFNSNDDVTSAGIDTNFDGVAEQISTFQYANDNLTTVARSNGDVLNYNYSIIIDNHFYLWENSVGRKNRKIIAGECYWNYTGTGYIYNLGISKNILLEDANAATFQVLPNNFYEFKTQTDSQSTTTTQYFFN